MEHKTDKQNTKSNQSGFQAPEKAETQEAILPAFQPGWLDELPVHSTSRSLRQLTVLRIQQRVGNAAVQRMLRNRRDNEDTDTEAASQPMPGPSSLPFRARDTSRRGASIKERDSGARLGMTPVPSIQAAQLVQRNPAAALRGIRVYHSLPHQNIQRVSFGKDGELSSDLKAIAKAAAEIVERRIMARDFEKHWKSFWKRYGKHIKPQPSLETYRNAVKGRVVHDMESSKNADIRSFLEGEKGLPLERQTAAVTKVGSRDTYMRRFAIRQGVDSVVSLLLHESWHGAGLGMGLAMTFELAFHEFEATVGYPMMMGGAKIESIKQKRRDDYDVDVSITYSLHKIGKAPLPSKVELQVAHGDSATVVHQKGLPSKVGRNTVIWKAKYPGWNSYSIRIRNVDEASLMAAKRIETNPRCVLGVSSAHCESD